MLIEEENEFTNHPNSNSHQCGSTEANEDMAKTKQ